MMAFLLQLLLNRHELPLSSKRTTGEIWPHARGAYQKASRPTGTLASSSALSLGTWLYDQARAAQSFPRRKFKQYRCGLERSLRGQRYPIWGALPRQILSEAEVKWHPSSAERVWK